MRCQKLDAVFHLRPYHCWVAWKHYIMCLTYNIPRYTPRREACRFCIYMVFLIHAPLICPFCMYRVFLIHVLLVICYEPWSFSLGRLIPLLTIPTLVLSFALVLIELQLVSDPFFTVSRAIWSQILFSTVLTPPPCLLLSAQVISALFSLPSKSLMQILKNIGPWVEYCRTQTVTFI